MQEEQKQTSFWMATAKGAFKGLLIGAAIGLTAGLLLKVALPLLAASAPSVFGTLPAVFEPFLTTGFFPTPLIVFNSALMSIGQAFSSGNDALKAQEHQSEHRILMYNAHSHVSVSPPPLNLHNDRSEQHNITHENEAARERPAFLQNIIQDAPAQSKLSHAEHLEKSNMLQQVPGSRVLH